MTLPKTIEGREQQKFVESPSRTIGTAVEVINGETEKIIRADSTTTENTTYVGYAEINSLDSAAVWRIMRVLTESGITSTAFADGNSNYDNIWDNRAGLSYT